VHEHDRLGNFSFERPVPFLKFRKMRLQGHVGGSPSSDRHLTVVVCHGSALPSHHIDCAVQQFLSIRNQVTTALEEKRSKQDTGNGERAGDVRSKGPSLRRTFLI
jgi:hypothetical protein